MGVRFAGRPRRAIDGQGTPYSDAGTGPTDGPAANADTHAGPDCATTDADTGSSAYARTHAYAGPNADTYTHAYASATDAYSAAAFPDRA